MKIINRIEIHYFRSVYKINLDRAEDLNILIGNNDSGKSNILKALNLFFNNQTELDKNFYFHDDLTKKRSQEVRKQKGKASIWIRIYFNNFLKWKSLPQEFSVKKSWNRYSEAPETIYSKDISPTIIPKFLNKLSFHYIPAIRGRDVFSYFLNMLHDTLFNDDNSELLLSTEALTKLINENTEEMTKKIEEGIGIKSDISPPTDLKVLFNSLDFSTSYNDHHVSLQKRGDGIQARHIPYILDFITKNSTKYHIWAYEEPKTSLELGAAFLLAKQFSDEFCKGNQIFVTTHSPAFYDIEGEHIAKWYISQNSSDSNAETSAKRVTLKDLLDNNLGITALITKRAKEEFDRSQKLKEENERLNKELQDKNLPRIIVEGVTDKDILNIAYEKLYPGRTAICKFISANGADNISSLIKTSKIFDESEKPDGDLEPDIIISLWDRDDKGMSLFSKIIGNYSEDEETIFYKIGKNKAIYAGILPITDEIKEFSSKYTDINIAISMELMFPIELINLAIKENILVFTNIKRDTALTKEKMDLTDIFINKYNIPEKFHFLLRKLDSTSSNKVFFSKWVKNKDTNYFKNFKVLFEQIENIINNHCNKDGTTF